jgi:protocatechuate 3,4-dioxygenase beta subunit
VSPNPHPTSTVTRRQAVGMAGAAGAAVLLSKVSGPDRLLESIGISDTAQAAATSCVLTPSKTEGPYFVDEKLNRSDIRTDPTDGTAQAGIPLSLTMVVVRADGDCAPVAGAAVDIWHANAAGKYSDISSEGTSGKKYLRGAQVTDAAGKATFTTIYPGWYSGRAVHVHFKVRLFDGTSKTYEFTSQLFFDPTTTNTVYATSAYSSRGTPNTPNSADNIYGNDGSKLVVALTPDGNGGYAVTITARLSRSGTTIATKTQGAVAAGARTLELRIPRATAGGTARLVMTYADASGARKTVRRAVTIPARRRG